jgi:hypothetical protein
MTVFRTDLLLFTVITTFTASAGEYVSWFQKGPISPIFPATDAGATRCHIASFYFLIWHHVQSTVLHIWLEIITPGTKKFCVCALGSSASIFQNHWNETRAQNNFCTHTFTKIYSIFICAGPERKLKMCVGLSETDGLCFHTSLRLCGRNPSGSRNGSADM